MFYIANLDLWDLYLVPDVAELEAAGLVEVVR